MKLSKNFYLILGFLLSMDLFYSLFDKHNTHELFIWTVDIWFYRGYRFLIVILIIKLYFAQKKVDSNKLI